MGLPHSSWMYHKHALRLCLAQGCAAAAAAATLRCASSPPCCPPRPGRGSIWPLCLPGRGSHTRCATRSVGGGGSGHPLPGQGASQASPGPAARWNRSVMACCGPYTAFAFKTTLWMGQKMVVQLPGSCLPPCLVATGRPRSWRATRRTTRRWSGQLARASHVYKPPADAGRGIPVPCCRRPPPLPPPSPPT